MAVTAFLSVGPKAAGFAALLRFVGGAFLGGAIDNDAVPWRAILAIVCVATMTLGNLAALGQHSLKRMLAYSSIAHAGYLLAGVTLAGEPGGQAVLFYLVVYVFMNLGAFACLLAFEDVLCVVDVPGCRGVGWRHPALAAALTLFLLSLTGIPPLAGFAGKVVLFSALVKAGTWPWLLLALAGVLNSVVSLFYYARIIKSMYLDRPDEAEAGSVVGALPAYYHALIWLCLAPTLVLGVWFTPLLEWTRRAAQAFAP
jgi:NADH-quinone oxidoreductase subunit N